MPEEKEAQARPVGKQASRDFADNLFAKGWDEVVEPKESPKPEQKAEEDCPDCPPAGETSQDKKPIRVLKHQGKDVPVYTQKQLDDLAQQGFDYTKKRQADAADRKKWEEEFAERNARTNEQAKRLDALIAQQEGKAQKPTEEVPKKAKEPTEEDILKEFGVDPEYATDYEKRVVTELVARRKETEQLKQVNQLMLLNEVFRRVSQSIEQAQREYPIEDVLREDGKSITQEQVVTVFKAKLENPNNSNRPIQELATETIKDIHEFQKKVKAPAPAASIDEEKMTPEEFAKAYPKLFAKLKGGNGAPKEPTEELPPSMDRGAKAPVREAIQGRVGNPKHPYKSIEEAIEAGFKDPETIKAFGG